MQESVVLFECHILHNMSSWPQVLYYQGLSRKWPLSMPSIGSSFKYKPKWIPPPYSKSTNQVVLSINNFFSNQLHIFTIGISSLPRLKEEMRLVNSFVASFILDFLHALSMAKLALQSTSKILNILKLLCMVRNSSLSTHESNT